MGGSSSFVPALFESRLNRFTIKCSVDGQPTLAYLANPGRLWEILLPGRKLYLKPSSGTQKFPYIVIAADLEEKPVLLHTHLTNFYVKKWLERKLIPKLQGYSLSQKEFRYGSSRFDFLLKEGQNFLALEVKTCTLFAHQLAFFPDAISLRGRRHLLALAQLAQNPHWQAAVLFVVWWPEARFFLPEFHTDWEFAQSFLATKDRIMYLALAASLNCDLEPDESSLRELTIPWDLLAKEAQDQGAYLLVIKVDERLSLPVGHLGQMSFLPGYYVYVGSARRDLQARLNRHLRRRKKLFWHIDYLLTKAKITHVLPIRSTSDLECLLAQNLGLMAQPIPAFGCSDCSCPSHLYFFPRPPLHEPSFLQLLHKFRYHRLESKLV